MIVRMARLGIAGPRPLVDAVLAALQDAGVLHVDAPRLPDPSPRDETNRRERRHIERCLADVEAAMASLGLPRARPAPPEAPARPAAAVRRARRLRRDAERLRRSAAALDDERILLDRYREFFVAFESLVGRERAWPDGQAFYVVLRAGAAASLADLRQALEAAVSGEVELLDHALSSGELAVLILASPRAAPKVASLLASSRVDELPVPAGLGETSLLAAMPALEARLAAIPREIEAAEAERLALGAQWGSWLRRLRTFLHDRLLLSDAFDRVHAAKHLFIIEGWVPASRVGDLESRLHGAFGPEVVVSHVGAEDWAAADAPVTLHNPPLFRPFEVLTRTLPLPRYGTIDPTPFVAVFFPAFFGLMLGDVGYGLMLAVCAVILRARSKPGSTPREISTVAFACASSAVAFGALFGELFGSFGRAVGLAPLFNRESATLPFLGLTVALGAVHVLLGLVLAAANAWRRGHRREATGRGVILAMLVLTAASLLAAFNVLPAALLTPFAVAVLVAFPLLVALEGIAAIVELLSAVGHVLSYARIMALGTASLMLAIVANEMVGAMGSVLVGTVFALLFHVVNFAIGLFSPAIHALRLHYVEFFGLFFSPGGTRYQPLGHWRPSS